MNAAIALRTRSSRVIANRAEAWSGLRLTYGSRGSTTRSARLAESNLAPGTQLSKFESNQFAAFFTSCPANAWVPFSQLSVTSAPASTNSLDSRSASPRGTTWSNLPADMKTGIPFRLGNSSGVSGTIGRNNNAPAGRRDPTSSMPAAMFAPFEYPTSTTDFDSKPYLTDAAFTKSASSFERNFRSSMSNTPSASLRKKRGMPFSITFPRGLSREASGASAVPSVIRSSSLPPVPCRRSRVSLLPFPGLKRWTKPKSADDRLIAISSRPLWQLDTGENLVQVLPEALELRGQHQPRTKLLPSLVDCEAGWVCGDLEQDPAGLPEVDGVEVLAVDDRGDVQPGLDELLPPHLLLSVVGRAPRDMVYRSHTHDPRSSVRLAKKVDQRPRASAPGSVPEPVSLLLDEFEPHGLGQE